MKGASSLPACSAVSTATGSSLYGPELNRLATFPFANKETGWHALLGPDYDRGTASAAAAPGRLGDASGLPPAYIEVGAVDIFRDESIAFASLLLHTGVNVELPVHPGLVHGFDHFAPDADATDRAIVDRVRTLRSL